jgi:ribose transport system permease protein
MSTSVSSQTPSTADRLRPLRETKFVKNYGPVIFFLLLIAVSACFTRNFLSLGTLEDTLVAGFPVMLAALGITLVMSSGGIDISVGSIMAISAAVSGRLYISDVGLAPSIAAGMLAGGLCGLFNGVLVSKFKIQPIVVTLVTMIAGRGLAQTILGKPSISFPFTSFDTLGLYRIAGIPIQVVILVVAVALMLFVAKMTVFAKHVEAIGDNPRAARLVGINVVFTITCVYLLCGILCGIAGVMSAAQFGGVNAAAIGRLVELDAIAAVAIGGTSFSGGRARILGTVFGAVVISLVTVIATMNNIPVHYAMIFKAAMVIAVLWVQREE